MNPLLEKYEELYGKKEEELKGIAKISLSEDLSKYLSTTSGTCGIASVSTSSTYITATNANVSIAPKPKAIKTFDPESCDDCFLQIAEKIKDQTAKVTSANIKVDMAGNFYTGLRTVTFEVQVYDAP
jgi:hypothetical protein